MKKAINIILGFIFGIGPLVIAGIFGILIVAELQNFIGVLIGCILVIVAIWAGIHIYKSIQRAGFIGFMTVVNASPDLDNLEPTEGTNTKKRTPLELADLNKENQNLFKGGTIKIFGDWFGEPYNNFLEILKITYDDSKKEMIIQFSKRTKIFIEEPNHILESSSVLKVLSAKRIRLEFQHKRKNSNKKDYFFKSYLVNKNRIETETNIDWTNSKIDASIGQDAVIIFN